MLLLRPKHSFSVYGEGKEVFVLIRVRDPILKSGITHPFPAVGHERFPLARAQLHNIIGHLEATLHKSISVVHLLTNYSFKLDEVLFQINDLFAVLQLFILFLLCILAKFEHENLFSQGLRVKFFDLLLKCV